ncbi:MAG: hypothetical protein ACI9G5_002700 [Paracoccaceae bacterium]|jgi:hypothetical protein
MAATMSLVAESPGEMKYVRPCRGGELGSPPGEPVTTVVSVGAASAACGVVTCEAVALEREELPPPKQALITTLITIRLRQRSAVAVRLGLVGFLGMVSNPYCERFRRQMDLQQLAFCYFGRNDIGIGYSVEVLAFLAFLAFLFEMTIFGVLLFSLMPL